MVLATASSPGAGLQQIALERIPMREFLDEYWSVDPGQHVCLVGPNGCGKTTIGMQLLAMATHQHPRTRGVALVMKPHKGPKSDGRRSTGDPTVSSLTRKYGGKVIRRWPPPPVPWRKEPAFWALWPPHTGDPDTDAPEHKAVMRKAILDLYLKGDSWCFADEAAGLSDDLDLEAEMKQTLTRGRSMRAAMILATQRPRFVPRAMFTESKHFFLWKMHDLAEYERLREIGGGQLQKHEIIAILQALTKHQCLYLYPDEGIACVLT